MKATVKVTNPKRGMFAAQNEAGQFVVFDLIDSEELRIGDVVFHPDLQERGGKEIKNLTRGLTMLVFVTNIVFSFEHACQLCFL